MKIKFPCLNLGGVCIFDVPAITFAESVVSKLVFLYCGLPDRKSLLITDSLNMTTCLLALQRYSP